MDFKEKISKEDYLSLKTTAKAKAEIGSAIRQAALRNKGIVRYKLRQYKSNQGRDTRIYNLALACLKDRKHCQIEPNADPANVPSATAIKSLLIGYVSYAYRKELEQDIAAFFATSAKEEAA